MRTTRSRPQAFAIVAVLALHLALLWLLHDASMPSAVRHDQTAAPARVTLRLIAAPRPELSPPVIAAMPAAARPNPAAQRARIASRAPDASATAAITEPRHEAVAPTELGASAPDVASPLLDTEASRRAIRTSARAASLGDRLARARGEPEPLGAQQRQANGVKAATKGDCLKGQYPGANMGLLSLPFLAVAAATGNCAK